MNTSVATKLSADFRQSDWHPYENQLIFKKSDLMKVPSGAFGIYGLWFRKRCIYVGKAEKQSIAQRLEQHWKGSHNPNLADWIIAMGSRLSVGYLVVADQSEISDLEKRYIKKFQPLTNRMLK